MSGCNKLSHSSTSLFQDCPQKFDYHYNQRLRSKISHAALLFGSAVDAAVTSLLQKSEKSPESVFDFAWTFSDINGVKTYLPTCTTIAYANSDYDDDLLTDKDCDWLCEEIKLKLTTEQVKDYVNKIYKLKEYKGFDKLPEDHKRVLNYANWLCLKHKGLLMIQAVKEKVMPNIIEVLGVQEYVKLENDAGDTVIGYADLVCRWRGIDSPVVFDFKTSAREYEDGKVLTSPQLTLYVHALSEKFENTRKAGYIVLHKAVRKNKKKTCRVCSKDGSGERYKTCDAVIEGKRCNGEWDERIDPKIYVQIMVDSIPERTEDIVLQNIDYINEAIKNGVFHRNLGSCVKGYGKCQYYNKCFYNSDEGLVKLEKKKE